MSNEFLVVVFDDKEKEQFITKALPTSLVYAFITDQENSNNEVQQSFIPFPNIGRATAITNKENILYLGNEGGNLEIIDANTCQENVIEKYHSSVI